MSNTERPRANRPRRTRRSGPYRPSRSLFAWSLVGALGASTLVPSLRAQEPIHEHGTSVDPAGPEGLPTPGTDHLTVTDHPDRGELVIALGPIDLPARTTHHELEQIPVQTGQVPFDFTLSGYRIEVVQGNGDPVPQTVVHHLNVLDPERRELFLPIMRRVLAASHETKPQHVPGWLLGLPFVGGDRFLALTMLHNPTDRTYRDVSVRLVMEYDRARALPVYRIYPFHLDVLFPTGSKAFDLPPGQTSRSWEGSPAIRGGIIGLGGHLHRYATELRLEDLTENRLLYRIRPVTDEEGHIHEVPVHRYSGRGIGSVIYPSHRYRVTAVYDNPTGEVIPDGGMGSVAGGFIPLDEWPAADPGDPLFQEDYRWVLRSLSHEAESHEHVGEETRTARAAAGEGAGIAAGNGADRARTRPAGTGGS